MAKLTAADIAKKAQGLYKPDEDGIFLASEMPDAADMRYIEMPQFWKDATNTKGIPFKKIVMIAGDSDSGKTSMSIQVIKAAQKQGVTILYVETEGKTSKKDFTDWGVDPNKIFMMKEAIAEKIYNGARKWLDKRLKANPNEELLIVFDSIGNVLSRHDAERDLETSSGKPGGKGKANREGLNTLIARIIQSNVALFVVNYTYDNIGSPGKTNAGGKAVNFFSSLTYQTSRKQWLEKTVKGEKVRIGARVQWRLFKNHIDRSNPGPKVVQFDITADGIEFVGGNNDEGDSSSDQ